MNEHSPESIRKVALAAEYILELLEQKRPSDTVDMTPSPAEPPAVEHATWWESRKGARPFRVEELSRDGKVAMCKDDRCTWLMLASELDNYTYLGTDAARRSGQQEPKTEWFSKGVSDALKAAHMGEEALSDSRVRSGAYPRRWGTLNGLCVRYCAAFQSGEGIPRAEAELAEYVRWLIAAGFVKP